MASIRPRFLLALVLFAAPVVHTWAGPDHSVDPTVRRRGARVDVVSPDRAETWVNGHTIRHVLLWDRRREALLVQLTFDNFHEVDWQNPRREETFSFYLPGVVRDATTGTFFTAGGQVPVAAYQRGGLSAGSIRPTAGTTIHVTKPEGQVHVVLTATAGSPAVADSLDGHWRIEGVEGVL